MEGLSKSVDTRLAVTQHYILRTIVEESILVPISPSLRQRDCLFVLNPIGRLVYEAIKAGEPLERVCSRVLADYESVSPEEVARDIELFVDQLKDIEAVRDDAAR